MEIIFLYKEIPEFKLQNYNMTLNEFKIIYWWEYFHRFLGRLIGIGYSNTINLFYFKYKIIFLKIIKYFLFFSLICFQGFIGWYMVKKWIS